MRIALHDADQTGFPNLALLKLSAWHKAKGDTVEQYRCLLSGSYDRVYSSSVFTFMPHEAVYGREVEYGGTGFRMWDKTLPDEIEHTCPDYAGMDYSLGFLTRGCVRTCEGCFVPRKEGGIRAHADIEEFAKHRDIVLMDNNVLAHRHGIEQIEKMARLGLRVDFNQGLDARLIDDGIARRLAALKWLTPLRLACDKKIQMPAIQEAVTLLRWHNCTPAKYFVYVLVRDIEDAMERVQFLKGMHLDPFVQPYRDVEGHEPDQEQKDFARWVNHKAIFKSVPWEEYRKRASA